MIMFMIRFCEKCCEILLHWYERMRDLRLGYIRRCISIRRSLLHELDVAETRIHLKQDSLTREIVQLNIRMTKG